MVDAVVPEGDVRAIDVLRPPLPPPPVDWLKRIGEQALKGAFHLLNPYKDAGHFTCPAPPTLPRFYIHSQDGAVLPVYCLEPAAGGAGEPVVLAHTLFGSASDFLIGNKLASILASAGYAVYLLSWRGDREGKLDSGSPSSADIVAELDIDAALSAILEHAGASRVLFVGHGLGLQLMALRLALYGEDRLAALVGIQGAFLFSPDKRALLARLLPEDSSLPARRIQQLLAPLPGEGCSLLAKQSPGESVRSRLRYTGNDVSSGLFKQVAQWWACGRLVDHTGTIEIADALSKIRLPALLTESSEDFWCPLGAAGPGIQALSGFRLEHSGWGHLDPLMAPSAEDTLYPAILQLFEVYRRRCW
jgi:predicted alpha/beta hydrolase